MGTDRGAESCPLLPKGALQQIRQELDLSSLGVSPVHVFLLGQGRVQEMGDGFPAARLAQSARGLVSVMTQGEDVVRERVRETGPQEGAVDGRNRGEPWPSAPSHFTLFPCHLSTGCQNKDQTETQ